MSKKTLVIGKDGQIGSALCALLGDHVLASGRDDINLTNADFITDLERFVDGHVLSSVINATAYNQVDLAEGDGKAEAFRVNGDAVGELAQWCKRRDIPLVHYSTDYVLDGTGNQPRTEDEPPAPLNAYGDSKLAGENNVVAAGGKYLIFRTSWVYDAHHKNFVATIRRLIAERDALNIVSDQVGAPSYAPHLAQATLEALQKADMASEFPSGVYHLCNVGEVSWYDFAQAIFMLAREYTSEIKCQKITPIPSSEYPTPADRPLNSRLDMTKIQHIFAIQMPEWKQGLQECFELIYEHNKH